MVTPAVLVTADDVFAAATDAGVIDDVVTPAVVVTAGDVVAAATAAGVTEGDVKTPSKTATMIVSRSDAPSFVGSDEFVSLVVEASDEAL